jgi:hypothetical protein
VDTRESEQLNIQVKNQVIQERSLTKVEYNTTFVFKTISACFGSSLLMQLISLIPSSYNLLNQLPLIISLLLIASSVILVITRKVPTIKTYLLILAVLIGLLIGA